ncbi:hypothetical protein B0H14DRAFT_2573269 [Mycena olivaceomarginata]|nr:hypothetical protein B0H14DRAFT_2573269 [Mycena olivaceomarginata]
MAPRPWADSQQTIWLQSWMSEFIKRQAEGKLHLFWPTMQEAWFQTYSEERILGLPLPTDADARVLTPDELMRLGAAITARKGQLENWFRNHRKRLGNANGPAAGATMTLVQRILKLSVPTRQRAHKHVEIFQIRNAGRIRDKTRPEAIKKRRKSERMRMRTRIVQAMWAEADEEERKAVEEEVEKEKKEMREEELRRENEVKEAKANNPWEMQEGIDVLETMLAEVHKAIFLATGWTPFTLVGGPNPRMGGDLTLKVLCFNQTPGGNDFEECCVDFDANVLQPFQDFLRLCYSLADRQACALPHRAPVVSDEPPVQRVLPPEPPAPEPVKAKKSKEEEEDAAEGDRGRTKSKPKNKTQPPKANEAPTVTASLTTGPDATTVLAGADDGFPQIDNGSGLFSNLETRGWVSAASASQHSSVASSTERNSRSLVDDLDLNSGAWSMTSSSFSAQLSTDIDCLAHDTSSLGGFGANVFGGDFAGGSAGFDNDGFDDDEALFPKTITTPPRGVDDPPPRLYLPETIRQGEVPSTLFAAFRPSTPRAPQTTSPPMMTPAIRTPTVPSSAGRTMAAMALETAKSRTLAAPVDVAAPSTAPVAPAPVAPVHVPGPSTAQSQTPLESIISTPATSRTLAAPVRVAAPSTAPVAPRTCRPCPRPGAVHRAVADTPAHVTSVTAAAGAPVVPGSRPLAKAPAAPAVPGSRPLAKAPAAPAVPGSRPLAKAPAKPPTKTVVAAKADKKEEAAAAAAKKSGVVESVEKRKRGRPRKQPLNDTTNELSNLPTHRRRRCRRTSPPSPTTTAGGARAAAEAEEAAKEKEAADAAAKQAARGWFEKTVNGATVVTLTNPTNPQTRSRKPTRLFDGSLATREVKGTRAKKPAPLDSVEEALLARVKTGSKRKSAAPIKRPAKKKRKA